MKQLFLSLCLAGAVFSPASAMEPNAPLIRIQSGDTDYRVNVLEEQVRQLNGRVEELNFQLLELQELIRKLQEDNDYRLREIEEKLGSTDSTSGNNVAANGTGNSGDTGLEKPEPSEQADLNTGSDGTSVQQPANKPKQTIDGVEIYDGQSGVDTNSEGSLGSLQFDENGNVVDSVIGKPLDLSSGFDRNDLSGNGTVAAPDPDTLFQQGYDYVQTGRYEDAERVLLDFSQNHAGHPRMAEARFWLGESYLGRGQYQEAAKVYLDAHKKWPNSRFGPQSLLKLGVSVAGLNQRELACATFAEVIQKYPDASRAIRRNVAYEQRAAQCVTN